MNSSSKNVGPNEMLIPRTIGEKIDLKDLLKKPGTQAPEDDGELDAKKLSDYADDLANDAYDFTLNVACKVAREIRCGEEEIGKEDFYLIPSNKAKLEERDRCDSFVQRLESFSPERDDDDDSPLCRAMANPDLRDFAKAMSKRPVWKTRLAKVFDDICHASREELEDILFKSPFFENSEHRDAPIKAFGERFDLAKDVFGRYQDEARKKLSEAIHARLATLGAEAKTVTKERVKDIASSESVSPEEGLFGRAEKVNGKSIVLQWEHNGFENCIVFVRDGDDLIITNAVGSGPEKALNQMRQEYGPRPSVFLDDILAEDNKHLCPKKDKGIANYDFGRFVEKERIDMTRWVRTAAGECLPNRLLPEEKHTPYGGKNNKKRERLIKNGEPLTPFEFYVQHGISTYDLVFPVGHFLKVKKEGAFTGEVITLTKKAVLRISRQELEDKEDDNIVKDFIVIESTDSEELATLLEKAGIENEGPEKGGRIIYKDKEYLDTKNWDRLPFTLSMATKRDFWTFKKESQGV